MKKIISGTYCLFLLLWVHPLLSQNNNPQWPTLAQQLSDANAISGSAFESLIMANQDFSMLREDEKNDLRNLPPWLRVYWRKAHPAEIYSAEDPTGGYPRVLNEIREWMQSHQNLLRGPGYEVNNGGGGITPNSTINNEVRVSGLQAVARSESDIRINFFDPTKIIAASNNIVGAGQQGMYYTTNSGVSWSQTLLPFTATDASHSDPTVDWTSNGTAWSSTLGIQGANLRLRNYQSANNGATWTFEATPSGSQNNVDKQMVWVDHSATSPYKDQQYAIWHNGNPAYVNRRTAGVAGTWLAAPIQVSGAESSGTCIGSDIKTNSYGDVFGFWPTTTNRKVLVVKSTNGGASYGTPVQIATTYDGYDIGVPSFNGRRALVYVTGGAYRTAIKNLVYACWTDLSGASGCTAAANEPGSNVASTCKTRIWFARSTDGGVTWNAPIKISDPASLNDQYNQWMTVDETNGVISIMYYDTKNDAGRKKSDVYFQFSSNDGVTWSTPERVTTAQTDETIAGADAGNQYGDYNGMSAYSGVVWPVWTDRRNNAKEEVWTAKISNSVLPVKLVQFNVYLQNSNNAMINWKITEAETGVIYELMRSNDGRNFTAINKQTGLASGIQFNYIDASLQNGNYYYRLKITGRSGEINYSNIALIKIGSKEVKVFVYPNPVQRTPEVTIQASITNATLQGYTLTDAQGRMIVQKNNINTNASTGIQLPAQTTTGTYLLRLQTDKGIFMERVIVY